VSATILQDNCVFLVWVKPGGWPRLVETEKLSYEARYVRTERQNPELKI